MKKDTYDEAMEKATEFAKGKNWKSIWPLNKCINVSYYDDNKAMCVDEFPYSVKRETQADEIYHVWNNDREKQYGLLRRFREFNGDGTFVSSDKVYWKNCKPTGFRWDVATESIIKIEDDND
jgi:hypothetical protein